MVKLIDKKIKASTLIEVLVAMVIIMVVFAIGIKIFSNILNSGVSFRKIQVQNQLKTLCEEVKQKGDFTEPKLELDNVEYGFVADTSAMPGVSKLEIRAFHNGKLLGSIKSLIKLKEVDAQD